LSVSVSRESGDFDRKLSSKDEDQSLKEDDGIVLALDE
jgi:hypothetical protein